MNYFILLGLIVFAVVIGFMVALVLEDVFHL